MPKDQYVVRAGKQSGSRAEGSKPLMEIFDTQRDAVPDGRNITESRYFGLRNSRAAWVETRQTAELATPSRCGKGRRVGVAAIKLCG